MGFFFKLCVYSYVFCLQTFPAYISNTNFIYLLFLTKKYPQCTTWDSLSTSPTQPTKRTECCVLGAPTTQDAQYPILSTSPVLTTGDTSSTTTTGLIPRILRGIFVQQPSPFVRLKCTVRIFTKGNESCFFKTKNNMEHRHELSLYM